MGGIFAHSSLEEGRAKNDGRAKERSLGQIDEPILVFTFVSKQQAHWTVLPRGRSVIELLFFRDGVPLNINIVVKIPDVLFQNGLKLWVYRCSCINQLPTVNVRRDRKNIGWHEDLPDLISPQLHKHHAINLSSTPEPTFVPS